MLYFTDQLGRTIQLDRFPQRIISLVPSQTELLHTLGLGEEIIGITKFCIHPTEWFHNKTRIGGTKHVDIAKVNQLRPDLLIANKEENDKTQIDELSRRYPVWVSDIGTLEDALEMIVSVGALTGKEQAAQTLADTISSRFAVLENHFLMAQRPSPPRAAYFIWRKPWMVAGGDTFIQDMLRRAGFTNVFGDQARYPSIALATLADLDPGVVLLSSEPYPFRDRHIAEIKAVLPEASVQLVDGEIFSWYGSRLLHAPAYLEQLAWKYPL